jgi:hypothetical protein
MAGRFGGMALSHDDDSGDYTLPPAIGKRAKRLQRNRFLSLHAI